MSWTPDDLTRIGDATELELASRRPDGTLGRYTIMWVVRVGDGLYAYRNKYDRFGPGPVGHVTGRDAPPFTL